MCSVICFSSFYVFFLLLGVIAIRAMVHWYSFDHWIVSNFLVELHGGKKSNLKEEELPFDSKAPTKNVISRDLQVHYLR